MKNIERAVSLNIETDSELGSPEEIRAESKESRIGNALSEYIPADLRNATREALLNVASGKLKLDASNYNNLFGTLAKAAKEVNKNSDRGAYFPEKPKVSKRKPKGSGRKPKSPKSKSNVTEKNNTAKSDEDLNFTAEFDIEFNAAVEGSFPSLRGRRAYQNEEGKWVSFNFSLSVSSKLKKLYYNVTAVKGVGKDSPLKGINERYDLENFIGEKGMSDSLFLRMCANIDSGDKDRFESAFADFIEGITSANTIAKETERLKAVAKQNKIDMTFSREIARRRKLDENVRNRFKGNDVSTIDGQERILNSRGDIILYKNKDDFWRHNKSGRKVREAKPKIFKMPKVSANLTVNFVNDKGSDILSSVTERLNQSLNRIQISEEYTSSINNKSTEKILQKRKYDILKRIRSLIHQQNVQIFERKKYDRYPWAPRKQNKYVPSSHDLLRRSLRLFRPIGNERSNFYKIDQETGSLLLNTNALPYYWEIQNYGGEVIQKRINKQNKQNKDADTKKKGVAMIPNRRFIGIERWTTRRINEMLKRENLFE